MNLTNEEGHRVCGLCEKAHCEREFLPEAGHPCMCARCVGAERCLEINEELVAEAKRRLDAEADAAHRAWRRGNRKGA